MKNNLVLFAAALALLVTTAASAQTTKMKADIPFKFIVNRATLPAGAYSVESLDEAGSVLAIRGPDPKANSLAMSNSCRSANPASQTKLVFHRYGDQYFLYQVWIQGKTNGREFLPSPREKEVAKDYSMHEVVLIASGR